VLTCGDIETVESEDRIAVQSAYVQEDICQSVGEERGGLIAYYEVREVGVHSDGGKVYEVSEL